VPVFFFNFFYIFQVKVDPAETESHEDDAENKFHIFQSQLVQNFNPNQFYIAKL